MVPQTELNFLRLADATHLLLSLAGNSLSEKENKQPLGPKRKMAVLPASRRSDQFAANAHYPPFLLAKLLD